MYPLKQVSRPQQEGEIPAELKVPDGEVLLFAAVGRGVQIYECTPSATDPSQSVWTFKEPHATLYDDEGPSRAPSGARSPPRRSHSYGCRRCPES